MTTRRMFLYFRIPKFWPNFYLRLFSCLYTTLVNRNFDVSISDLVKRFLVNTLLAPQSKSQDCSCTTDGAVGAQSDAHERTVLVRHAISRLVVTFILCTAGRWCITTVFGSTKHFGISVLLNGYFTLRTWEVLLFIRDAAIKRSFFRAFYSSNNCIKYRDYLLIRALFIFPNMADPDPDIPAPQVEVQTLSSPIATLVAEAVLGNEPANLVDVLEADVSQQNRSRSSPTTLKQYSLTLGQWQPGLRERQRLWK